MKCHLMQANQDLAAEQGPAEGERQRKVGFKTELIETCLADSSLSSISKSDDDNYEK